MNPLTAAALLDLLADALRERAGTAQLDKVAVLQRLLADAYQEIAAMKREADDELLTVSEAVALVGGTSVKIRSWIRKYQIGYLDKHFKGYLIFKKKLLEVAAARASTTKHDGPSQKQPIQRRLER